MSKAVAERRLVRGLRRCLALPAMAVAQAMTPSELTSKCGPPTSHDSRTEDIKARNRNNGLLIKTGETTTETWIYDRGPQAAPMVVIIVDGRIKSIERQEK